MLKKVYGLILAKKTSFVDILVMWIFN